MGHIGTGHNYIFAGTGRPDRPLGLIDSKGSLVVEVADWNDTYRRRVDKSLVHAFHVGEIEKSIKHGHVTPARTLYRRRLGWDRNDSGIAMVIGFRAVVDRLLRTKDSITSLDNVLRRHVSPSECRTKVAIVDRKEP